MARARARDHFRLSVAEQHMMCELPEKSNEVGLIGKIRPLAGPKPALAAQQKPHASW